MQVSIAHAHDKRASASWDEDPSVADARILDAPRRKLLHGGTPTTVSRCPDTSDLGPKCIRSEVSGKPVSTRTTRIRCTLKAAPSTAAAAAVHQSLPICSTNRLFDEQTQLFSVCR